MALRLGESSRLRNQSGNLSADDQWDLKSHICVGPLKDSGPCDRLLKAVFNDLPSIGPNSCRVPLRGTRPVSHFRTSQPALRLALCHPRKVLAEEPPMHQVRPSRGFPFRSSRGHVPKRKRETINRGPMSPGTTTWQTSLLSQEVVRSDAETTYWGGLEAFPRIWAPKPEYQTKRPTQESQLSLLPWQK
jgi:hypothetical protein